MQLDDVITVAEATSDYGISRGSLYWAIRARLSGACRKSAGTWLISRPALERLIIEGDIGAPVKVREKLMRQWE